MQFSLIGGFERGCHWWFAVIHGSYGLVLGEPSLLKPWLEGWAAKRRPERVCCGRWWAVITPTPPEKTE